MIFQELVGKMVSKILESTDGWEIESMKVFKDFKTPTLVENYAKTFSGSKMQVSIGTINGNSQVCVKLGSLSITSLKDSDKLVSHFQKVKELLQEKNPSELQQKVFAFAENL
jgi:hypothetical protein